MKSAMGQRLRWMGQGIREITGNSTMILGIIATLSYFYKYPVCIMIAVPVL